jgi:hypothetical protein
MKRLLAGAALALAFPAFAAPPVAFVAELEPGTRLFLGSDASVAVSFAGTGTEFTLVGPGESVVLSAEVSAAAGRFSERVLHALLLHDIGAHQEARSAWEALARERPDLPELSALAR